MSTPTNHSNFRLEANLADIPRDESFLCKLFESDGSDKIMIKEDDRTLKNSSTGDTVNVSSRKSVNTVLIDPDTLSLEEAKRYLSKCFTWGKVKSVHVVGDYQIAEYHPRKSEGSRILKEPDLTKTEFHTYIDWKDAHHSYSTLEEALIGVIAMRFDGLNSQAAMYFSKMIGIKGTYEDHDEDHDED